MNRGNVEEIVNKITLLFEGDLGHHNVGDVLIAICGIGMAICEKAGDENGEKLFAKMIERYEYMMQQQEGGDEKFM